MTFNSGAYNEATIYVNPTINCSSDEMLAPKGSVLEAVSRVNYRFFKNVIYPNPFLLKLLASTFDESRGLTMFVPSSPWTFCLDRLTAIRYAKASITNSRVDALNKLSPYLVLNTLNNDANNIVVYKGEVVNYAGNRILAKINCTNGVVYVTTAPIKNLREEKNYG